MLTMGRTTSERISSRRDTSRHVVSAATPTSAVAANPTSALLGQGFSALNGDCQAKQIGWYPTTEVGPFG